MPLTAKQLQEQNQKFAAELMKNNPQDFHPNGKILSDEQINAIKTAVQDDKEETRYPKQHLKSLGIDINRGGILRILDPVNNEWVLFATYKKSTDNDIKKSFVLGEGSFGKVKLIQNLNTGEFYALKITKPKIDERENNLIQESFQNEILFNAQLNRGHGVRLKKINASSNKSYGIQNLAVGYNLQLALTQGQLSFDNRFKSAINAFEEIHYIHSKNLIHRDIKVDNLIYDPDNQNVTAVDFGLMIRAGTAFDRVTGTPGHVAPEITENHPYTDASDVYALGRVVQEIFGIKDKSPDGIQFGLLDSNLEVNAVTFEKHFINEIEKLTKKMLDPDPQRRIKLTDAIDELNKLYVSYQSGLTAEQQQINELEKIKNQEKIDNEALTFFLNSQVIGPDDSWVIERLAQSKLNLNGVVNLSNETPLQLAVRNYDKPLAITKAFLERNVDVNHVNDTQESALLNLPLLSDPSKHEIVKLLIDNGANIYSTDSFNKNALFYAHGENIRILNEADKENKLAKGIDNYGWNPILNMDLVDNDALERLKLYLDMGIPLETASTQQKPRMGGQPFPIGLTILHKAFLTNGVEEDVINYIISIAKPELINAKDEFGWTAAHYLLARPFPEEAKEKYLQLLIKAGADLTITTAKDRGNYKAGTSLVKLAQNLSEGQVVKLLQQHGAQLDSPPPAFTPQEIDNILKTMMQSLKEMLRTQSNRFYKIDPDLIKIVNLFDNADSSLEKLALLCATIEGNSETEKIFFKNVSSYDFKRVLIQLVKEASITPENLKSNFITPIAETISLNQFSGRKSDYPEPFQWLETLSARRNTSELKSSG